VPLSVSGCYLLPPIATGRLPPTAAEEALIDVSGELAAMQDAYESLLQRFTAEHTRRASAEEGAEERASRISSEGVGEANLGEEDGGGEDGVEDEVAEIKAEIEVVAEIESEIKGEAARGQGAIRVEATPTLDPASSPARSPASDPAPTSMLSTARRHRALLVRLGVLGGLVLAIVTGSLVVRPMRARALVVAPGMAHTRDGASFLSAREAARSVRAARRAAVSLNTARDHAVRAAAPPSPPAGFSPRVVWFTEATAGPAAAPAEAVPDAEAMAAAKAAVKAAAAKGGGKVDWLFSGTAPTASVERVRSRLGRVPGELASAACFVGLLARSLAESAALLALVLTRNFVLAVHLGGGPRLRSAMGTATFTSAVSAVNAYSRRAEPF